MLLVLVTAESTKRVLRLSISRLQSAGRNGGDVHASTGLILLLKEKVQGFGQFLLKNTGKLVFFKVLVRGIEDF